MNQSKLAESYEKLMRLEKAEAANRTCPPAYLLTPPRAEDAFGGLANYLGKQISVTMIDTWMACAHVEFRDAKGRMVTDVVPLNWLTRTSSHDFPNTGAQRSWCNGCGLVGRFDWRSGKFEAK